MNTHPQSPDALAAGQALGGHLQAMRKRHRLTQAQLAQRAGIGRTTLHKLESGHPGVAMATLIEVLLVLDRGMVDRLLEVVAADPIGLAMERQRLPQRVGVDDDF